MTKINNFKRAYLLVFLLGFASGGAVILLLLNPMARDETLQSANPASNRVLSTPPVVLSKPIHAEQVAAQTLTNTVPNWKEAFHALALPREREQFMVDLIESRMRQSPHEVLSFLKSLEPSRLRNAAIAHALRIYAETSPEDALTQASQLLQGGEANNAIVDIAQVWGTNNPAEAIAWVERQEESKTSLTVLENLVTAATQNNPDQMRYLIENSSLGGKQARLAAQALAGVWAQNSPHEATEWAKGYAVKTGDAGVLSTAYLNWATLDPAGAAAALAAEEGRFSAKLAPEIAEIWSSQDPKSAATWAVTTAAGEQHDKTIASVAEVWATSDPENAFAWASSLSQSDKATALKSVALRWSLLSPQAFQQKLTSLPLEARQQIHSIMANSATARHH